MTEATVAVGIDVGGTKVLALALTASGDSLEPVGQCRVPTPDSGDGLIEAITTAARDAAADAGAAISALATGVPGLVDDHGVMRFAANLPAVRELPLRELLHARFDVPVAVDNDANAAAWGERVAGAGEGADHMLMVTLGTGVGGGIVLDGHLYRGAHGMAGEIGHFVVKLDGEACSCGQHGCWERYASGTALGRIAKEAGFESGEAVVSAAGSRDAGALDVLDTFTRWVAIGLAGLANTLDPALIVIGGGLVEVGDLLLAPLRRHFGELIEGGEHRPEVPIRPAKLGEQAGAIGAALIARELVQK
ncbi:MAG: glucokinase [Actinomycetota bacterium]